MSIKNKFFLVAAGLILVSSNLLFALSNSADSSLSKGKKLYADGRYEEAMDSFIDVFVSGNPDQIAEANEYVNLIHFERGGVVPPKQVPYDKELEDRQNLGVQGRDLYGDKNKKPAATSKDKEQPPLKEIFNKEKPEADVAEPPASVPEADPFKKPEVVAQADEEQTADVDENGEAKPQKQPKDAAATDGKTDDATPVGAVAETGTKDADKENAQAAETAEAAEDAAPQETIVAADDSFPKGSKAKVRDIQRQKENEKRLEMRDEAIARLKTKKDVQVYMRGGKVDAIDIPSDIAFRDRTINKNAAEILDDVYALMILEDAPAYYILPEGSYTDDVTIQGVRQAVTLNSYLINRGISSGKMNLNMGLSTQEPPEKFRNLAGASIVFDYDGDTRLQSKLQEKNLPPILSLAVYPFKEIIPAWDEEFVIDFSVIEATAPIKEWSLQIVSHNIDDHFYVVKQYSGKEPVAYQAFWNGKKRFFGQILPTGDYTLVLRATDTEGRERIVKRKVVILDAPEKYEPEYIKTEPQVVKEEKKEEAKQQKAAKEGKLDYNQKRLWNKPGKKQMSAAVEETPAEEKAVQQPAAEAPSAAPAETPSAATTETPKEDAAAAAEEDFMNDDFEE